MEGNVGKSEGADAADGTAKDAGEKGATAGTNAEARGGDPPEGGGATPAPESAALERCREALSRLPPEAGSYCWVGSTAARTGATAPARKLLPDDAAREAFDKGVLDHARGVRHPRPAGEAACRKVMRAMESLGRPSATGKQVSTSEPASNRKTYKVRVADYVRRTRGRGQGAQIDMSVIVSETTSESGTSASEKTARLLGLDGGTLVNFTRILALAAEEGVILPPMKKAAWLAILAKANRDARVEEAAPDESVADAIENAIRTFLRETPRSTDLKDLEAGDIVVEHQNRFVVKSRALIAHIQAALPNDNPTRPQIGSAARRLQRDDKYRSPKLRTGRGRACGRSRGRSSRAARRGADDATLWTVLRARESP